MSLIPGQIEQVIRNELDGGYKRESSHAMFGGCGYKSDGTLVAVICCYHTGYPFLATDDMLDQRKTMCISQGREPDASCAAIHAMKQIRAGLQDTAVTTSEITEIEKRERERAQKRA